MKKGFKYYIGAWAVLFAAFNIITLTVQFQYAKDTAFQPSFWVGYISVWIAFLVQAACAYIFFKEETKRFLNLSFVSTSYTGLVVTTVIGIVLMVIPKIPSWLAVVAAVAVSAFYIVELIKVRGTEQLVSESEQSVKENTAFIRGLQSETEQLKEMAGSAVKRKAAGLLYEAVRYSDPVSNDGLAEIEMQIRQEYKALKALTDTQDDKKFEEQADKVIQLVRLRSSQCKVHK